MRCVCVCVWGVVCLGMCVHARAKNLSARLRSSPPPPHPLRRTDVRHWLYPIYTQLWFILMLWILMCVVLKKWKVSFDAPCICICIHSFIAYVFVFILVLWNLYLVYSLSVLYWQGPLEEQYKIYTRYWKGHPGLYKTEIDNYVIQIPLLWPVRRSEANKSSHECLMRCCWGNKKDFFFPEAHRIVYNAFTSRTLAWNFQQNFSQVENYIGYKAHS